MKALVMVVHNHQPVGNLPENFDGAFQRAYEPFLRVLEKHPEVRVGLHFSGPLLDWLEAEQPDYLQRLRRLLAAGRVEMLAGTLYEAILCGLPRNDQLAQAELARKRVKELFEVEPSGAWLPERVWEQAVAGILAEAGYAYTFLDDTNFDDCSAKLQLPVFSTEETGRCLALLPICTQLRRNLPFNLPERTLEIALQASAQTGYVIFADDGEKFGDWPATYEWVYEEGYLERFFNLVEDSAELEMLLPSELLQRFPSRARCYLSSGSYSEMQEWSDGNWRNFFLRYAEANWMHKRMLETSRRVAFSESEEALHHLLKAQCNCAYWHGTFGGLYYPHLRRAVYHHLLKAESAAEAPPVAVAEVRDLDCDGALEVILDNCKVGALLKAEGASLHELDYRSAAQNLTATLRRRREVEVDDKAGVEGAPSLKLLPGGEFPREDWHARACFLDHLLVGETSAESFERLEYQDAGDFVLEAFDNSSPRHTKQAVQVTFSRVGHLWKEAGRGAELELHKTFILPLAQETVACDYWLRNSSEERLDFELATEFNFCLSDPSGEQARLAYPDGTMASPEARLQQPDVQVVTLSDKQGGWRLHLETRQAAAVWQFPVETLAVVTSNIERQYQATCLVLRWRLSLEPWQEWRNRVELTLQPFGEKD